MKKNLLILVLFLCATLPAQDFKFVIWSDSQFQNPQVFENYVKETEALKPSFVVHTGDIIHGHTSSQELLRKEWQRFRKQIQPLTCPFYPTAGNHDITTKEAMPIYIETWGKEKLYYSINYENVHFIVLNTFLNIDSFYTFSHEEIEWLKKDLAENKAKHIFVSFHPPLHMSEKDYWKPFHELFVKYHVKGVFTGHSHIYDYRVLDGINYFCTNTSGNMSHYGNHLLGASHGFTIVSIKGDSVYFAFKADGVIYPADAVVNSDKKEAHKLFLPEQSLIINDPSKETVNQTIKVPIKNNGDKEHEFILTWKTENFTWNFKPYGTKFTLKAGESKIVSFNISAIMQKIKPSDMPYLEVKIPYTTEKGYKSDIYNIYRLFSPPKMEANNAKSQIEIDGKLDDKAWSDTKGIDNFYTDFNFTPADQKTVVKVLYDDHYLYVGIKGDEPNPEKLAALAYGKIPYVFGDDDFEFYFDTKRDMKNFYRIMINPKGTLFYSSPKGLFTYKFESKTYVGRNFWSAEFKIPFSELGITKPTKNSIWGFDARRNRLQSYPDMQSDWSKMENHPPYQPEKFGEMVFQ